MARADRSALDVCTKLAASQSGVISRKQALLAGLSASAVKRLVAEGLWQRILPSTYVLWTPTAPDEVWLQRLRAGSLWLGSGSAVFRRAAAALWSLDGVTAAPSELLTTCRRRSTNEHILVYTVGFVRPADIRTRLGMPVTSVARTLVDLATLGDRDSLEQAFESALRRRLATPDAIKNILAGVGPTQRGRKTIRDLVERHPTTATESLLETMVWQMLREGGLPLPVRQYVIRDPSGRFVARVDFAYPDACVVIEADGYEFHSKKPDWRHGLARQNALTRLGWIVYRVTWEDVTRWRSRTLADIAGLLRRVV